MKIKYCIPSYNRADGLKTHKYLKEPKIYISKEDYPRYCELNKGYEDRFVVVPDGVQGKGKGHAMNWLLDNEFDDDLDALVIIDDDITSLMAHSKTGKDYEITEAEFYEIVENHTLLAKEWGCGLFSYGLNSDRLSYIESTPFRTHSYVDGAFQGFVRKDDIRYDEVLTVKEDVDMFLQQLKRYHKCLRIDKYYLKKDSFGGNTGGCNDFRSSEIEKQQFQMMQRKWGTDVIRPNKPTAKSSSKIRGYGGAIKLNIPLKGV